MPCKIQHFVVRKVSQNPLRKLGDSLYREALASGKHFLLQSDRLLHPFSLVPPYQAMFRVDGLSHSRT